MGKVSKERGKLLASEERRDRVTDMGCPDCSGVLALEVLGEQGHLRFCCQVGHAFSQESLMRAKEEQLERSLWSTIETYEEIKLLCQALQERAEPGDAAVYSSRAKRAAEVSSHLRKVLAEDGPVVPPEPASAK